MNQTNEFLSNVLCRGSRAFAGYAADALLQMRPEAQQGFEPDPFQGWQNWMTFRVEELAAAAAANRPQLFTSQVHWAKAVLAARGISTEQFRTSLECLRKVLANELPEQVRQLATEYLDQSLAVYDEEPVNIFAPLLRDTELGRLASAYLLALLEGDRRRASQLVLGALEEGREVRDLYLQVLLPAQEELGRMWLANEINVAEEHFASQTTKMVMAQLLPHASCRPSSGKTFLAAAIAGNQHDIGLQAVADFFEMDGWRTLQLGANVPVRDLVQAVDCFDVDLLGLAASQATHIESVRRTIEAVRAAPCGDAVKILVGGRAFEAVGDLPAELGADGYAANPVDAVRVGTQLVGLDADGGGAP